MDPADRGVSRGTSTRRWSSLSATPAARWIRFACHAGDRAARGHGARADDDGVRAGRAGGVGRRVVLLAQSAWTRLPCRRRTARPRLGPSIGGRHRSPARSPAAPAGGTSPTSAPDSASARRTRAAYGAPDAPVIPSITRMAESLLGRWSTRAEPDDDFHDLLDLGLGDLAAERRHPAAAVLDLGLDGGRIRLGAPFDGSADVPPPAPKLWQPVQPLSAITVAAAGVERRVSGDVRAGDGSRRLVAAIVSAISTAGVARPMATPHGRRESRRSRPRSRNGHMISSTIRIVGMMIVAKISCSGVLKIRSSSNRNKKYHSGRGSVDCTPGSPGSRRRARASRSAPSGWERRDGPAVTCQMIAMAMISTTMNRLTTCRGTSRTGRRLARPSSDPRAPPRTRRGG